MVLTGRVERPSRASETRVLSFAPREGWGRQPDSNRHRQRERLPGSPLPHAASWSPNTGSNRARPGTSRPPRRRGWGHGIGADPRCRTEPSWASTRRFHRVSLIGSVWSCCSGSNRVLLDTGQARFLQRFSSTREWSTVEESLPRHAAQRRSRATLTLACQGQPPSLPA